MNFFFPSVIFAAFPSVSKVKREHGFRTGLADTWSNSGFPNQSVWLNKNIQWKKLLDICMFFWSRLWWTFLGLKQSWPVYEAALQLLIRKGIADINSSVLPLFFLAQLRRDEENQQNLRWECMSIWQALGVSCCLGAGLLMNRCWALRLLLRQQHQQ